MIWHLAPSVLIAEVQSEAVLLNTSTGHCFVLDSLGLAICKLIEAECEVTDIVTYLQDQFPDAAAHIPDDVASFIQDLVDAELIYTKSLEA